MQSGNFFVLGVSDKACWSLRLHAAFCLLLLMPLALSTGCGGGGSSEFLLPTPTPTVAPTATTTPNPNGTATPVGNAGGARESCSATLLNSGMVLIAAGFDGAKVVNTANLFNPANTSFTATGNLNFGREDHTANLLPNGQVLITGGFGGTSVSNTAELYNPSTGVFTQTPNMTTPRAFQTATLLLNGMVLITGGLIDNTNSTASAELFNPATGAFIPITPMGQRRAFHTATLLGNGNVLIAGGLDGANNLVVASAEIFNPSTGNFSPTSNMHAARQEQTATLLVNGTVLITGGADNTGNVLASAEIYTPAAGNFALTGSMAQARDLHTANLLSSGQVLITGGVSNGNQTLASTELFNPSTGTFVAAGNLSTPRSDACSTALANNSPLGVPSLATADDLINPRSDAHSAALTSNVPLGQQVLIVGGEIGSMALASADLFSLGTPPPTPTPTPTSTFTPTPTPSPTPTPPPTPTPTPTPTPIITPTPPFTPTPTPTPSPTPTPGISAAGSGLFAVDCTRNLAYIPMLTRADPQTGHGRVAVINTGVDPNKTDPRITSVVLSHSDNPTGTALDAADGIIVVTSGSSGSGGFVDLINENTNALIPGSPFPFPAGSEAGFFGQVLFDPMRKKAIIETFETEGCPTAGTCTGFTTFDIVAHTFTPIIPANYAETFAFNESTNVVIDASDDNGSGMSTVVDVGNSVACTLNDVNIGGDQDGASLDSTTGIVVISNEDGTATVINLNGSSFSGTKPPCTLNEGGMTPNSLLVSGLPGSTAGSAVNPVTHQAFLIEDGSPGITLLSLPSLPIAQIPTALPTPAISSIPNDPSDMTWGTQGDPYAVAVETCNSHNSGLAVNFLFTYLAQVDLAAFQANPGVISTVLPEGTCAGTTTTFGCNNGKGVVFYPLPP